MKIRLPDNTWIYTEDFKAGLSGTGGSIGDCCLECVLSGDRLLVRLTCEDTPVRFVRLRWHFTPEEKRRDLIRVLGDQWERGGGELEWRGIVPERAMPWFFLLSNGTDTDADCASRFTEAFGVRTQPLALCFWQHDAAGITLWIDVRSGGRGVRLNARVLNACVIIFSEYRCCSAFDACQRFCSEMCPAPRRIEKPVYGANNWYYAYGNSSECQIVEDAKELSRLCEGNENRPFMVVDDGWTIHPKNGPWNCGNERFPDMKALADKLHSLNVRPGIWVRLQYNKGNVCALPEEWMMPGSQETLDVSRSDVLVYIGNIVKRFVDWGYELIKFDCSTQDILTRRGYKIPYVIAPDNLKFNDDSHTTAEILSTFYRTIREAAGERALIMGCATLTHLSAGLFEIVRTGADVNGLSWDITRRMGVNTLAFRMPMHRRFFEVDADCAPITDQLPRDAALQWLDILSKSGTPLFVSHLQSVSADCELRDAYTRASKQQDILVPVDWMENICPENWLLNGEKWTRDWFIDEIPVRGGSVPQAKITRNLAELSDINPNC